MHILHLNVDIMFESNEINWWLVFNMNINVKLKTIFIKWEVLRCKSMSLFFIIFFSFSKKQKIIRKMLVTTNVSILHAMEPQNIDLHIYTLIVIYRCYHQCKSHTLISMITWLYRWKIRWITIPKIYLLRLEMMRKRGEQQNKHYICW